jgi:hypothetical protein
MPQLRPNNDRARNAIWMIWIVMGLDIVSAVSSYFQYKLLQSAANGEEVSQLTAAANDLREQVIGIVYLLAYIVSIYTFIAWFRRAYFNLHRITGALSYSEGWAAGAWFVPIINLYRPYQIMRELYYRTYFFLQGDDTEQDHAPSVLWVGWWWAFWIINNFVGQIDFRLTFNANTIDEYITASWFSIVNGVVGIPLAILAVKVIRDYMKMEEELYGKVQELGSLVTSSNRDDASAGIQTVQE